MFKLADNKEIGQYLLKRIDKRFKSHRQFCAQYIETDTGRPADHERIAKMSNRLSQILKGEKGIQVYDLPLFCQLLEVSCEDILSAGRDCIPASTRLTNYAAAFSKDEQEWEAYVNREDSPILNADEFETTDRVGFPNKFLFPFIGELIERLIQNKNGYAEYMLKAAILHNQFVYDQLSLLLADAVRYFKELDYDLKNEAITNDLTKGILRDMDFYDDGNLLSYFALLPGTKKGLRTNIIRVNTESADTVISLRIQELNELYEAIHNIKPHFEGGKDDAFRL